MRTRDLAFASRPRVRMAERLFYGRDMAFAPYGEFWRQARRVTVLHLLSPRRVLSLRGVREQEVAALLGGGGETVNLSDLLMSYAHGVISRAAFGHGGAHGFDGDEGGEKLRKLFADFEGLLGTMTVGEFVPWLAWVDKLTGLDAKVARTSAAMDGLLERVIADHRERRRSRGQAVGDGEADADHRDFVDVMLDVSEAEEGAGAGAGGVLFDTVAIKAVILLALANLLYHFDWELPPPAASGIMATTRLDMDELFGLSVRLKADLNLVAKPWSPGAS
uniref:Cytochrome P450 n=1 Tax=Oryza barthii TaxID=65489 RepID=A0A0D3ELB3_9ORYZ